MVGSTEMRGTGDALQANSRFSGSRGRAIASGLYHFPAVHQAGRPMTVEGPFDGNLRTTLARMGGQRLNLLAESPRKLVIETNRNSVGLAAIVVEKREQVVARCLSRSVKVKLSVPKQSLSRGERSSITLTLTGLEGIETSFAVRLTNKTPAVIQLDGGDSQQIIVEPEQAKGGTFTAVKALTGIQAGGFEVGAVIEGGAAAQCQTNKNSLRDAASSGMSVPAPATTAPSGTSVPGPATTAPSGTVVAVPSPATTAPASNLKVAGPTVQPFEPIRGPNLSRSGGWNSHDPEIASFGNTVYITWVMETPGNAEVFISISSDAGSGFGPFTNLSHNPGQSRNPRIAASGDSVCVAWEDNSPGNFDVFYSMSLDRGATWSAPRNISANRGRSRDPQVAFLGADPIVVWADDTSGSNEILFANARTSNTLSISNPTNIFRRVSPSNSRSPRIVVSNGKVYVVWEDDPIGDYDVYVARSTDQGRTFQRAGFENSRGQWLPGIWSDLGDQFHARVAASGDNVYIVYDDRRPGVRRVDLMLSSDAGDSLFNEERPDTLQRIVLNSGNDRENTSETRSADSSPINPAVAAAGNNASFAWDQYICRVSDCFRQISFASGTAGRYGPVFAINNSGDARLPQIALYGSRRFVVFQMAPVVGRQNDILVWDSSAGTRNISNTAGDSLKPKVTVSGGNLVMVWEENTGGNQQVYFASTPAS
jgi:hypothetical protein